LLERSLLFTIAKPNIIATVPKQIYGIDISPAMESPFYGARAV
jgi:hypothetical protein